jgi:shikimate kinase
MASRTPDEAEPIIGPQSSDAALIADRLGERSIVLVGLMGAGKSSVGKRLAQRLQLPFVDADTAIEQAAGLTIPEIFARMARPISARASGVSSPGC